MLNTEHIRRLEKERGLPKVYKKVAEAFRTAEDGNVEPLVECVCDALHLLGLADTAPIWSIICQSLFGGDDENSGAKLIDVAGPRFSGQLIKLSAAGSGWSGSSAIFDYLAGHSEINHISGEFMHINGAYGLNGLIFGDAAPFSLTTGPARERISLDDLRRSFLYCFLGLTHCDDRTQSKHATYARYLVVNGGQSYASAVARFIGEALLCNLRAEHISRVSEAFIDECCRSIIGQDAKLVALDNVLPAYRLSMLQFLKSVRIFAVFRDPRDQFVDNLLHNARFHKKVGRFTEWYRASRDYLEKVKNTPFGDRVLVVRFEEFVLSEAERLRVADFAEVTEAAEMYNRFSPSESSKNIGLYKDPAFNRYTSRIESDLESHLFNN